MTAQDFDFDWDGSYFKAKDGSSRDLRYGTEGKPSIPQNNGPWCVLKDALF